MNTPELCIPCEEAIRYACAQHGADRVRLAIVSWELKQNPPPVKRDEEEQPLSDLIDNGMPRSDRLY